MSILNLQTLLETLKRVKDNREYGLGHSFAAHISTWIPDPSKSDQRTRLLLQTKFLAEMQTTILSTQLFVDSLELLPEAREGVNSILNSMAVGFSAEGSNTAIQSLFPALEMSILNLSMLISVLSMKFGAKNYSDEMDCLIEELRDIISAFTELNISRELKEKILNHLIIVMFMCENYRYIGVDAALSAYLQTAVRVTRENEFLQKQENSSWFSRLRKWGTRLNSAGDLVESGDKIIEAGGKIADFLS